MASALGKFSTSEADTFTVQGDGSLSINSKYFDEDFKELVDFESQFNPSKKVSEPNDGDEPGKFVPINTIEPLGIP